MEEYMHAHKETVDKVNSDMPDDERGSYPPKDTERGAEDRIFQCRKGLKNGYRGLLSE